MIDKPSGRLKTLFPNPHGLRSTLPVLLPMKDRLIEAWKLSNLIFPVHRNYGTGFYIPG
jgi:hypothetical protein